MPVREPDTREPDTRHRPRIRPGREPRPLRAATSGGTVEGMLRRVAPAALVVTATLFGLACGTDVFTNTEVDGGIEASTDGGVPQGDADANPRDAGSDAGECVNGGTVELIAEADAFLIQSLPTYPYGAPGHLHVSSPTSVSGTRNAIIRFDLATLPSNVNIVSMQLALTYLTAYTACTTGGSCSSVCYLQETTGPIQAFFMRSDWDESTVTWESRSPNNLWGQKGAAGTDASDRSLPFSTFQHKEQTSEVIQVTAHDLEAAAPFQGDGGKLISFLLAAQPDGGARFMMASKDLKQWCPANSNAPPTLTVRYCPN